MASTMTNYVKMTETSSLLSVITLILTMHQKALFNNYEKVVICCVAVVNLMIIMVLISRKPVSKAEVMI